LRGDVHGRGAVVVWGVDVGAQGMQHAQRRHVA
jgi:hypothetical protein